MGLRQVLVADDNPDPEDKTITAFDASRGLCKAMVDEDRMEVFAAEIHRHAHRYLGTPGEMSAILNRPATARDAQEAVAFSVSELAYVEQKIQSHYYQPMQADQFVPMTAEAGPAATTIEYQIEDQVGISRDADSQADDVPTVEVMYARKSFPVIHYLQGYGYTQQELRTSALLKRPLPARRLETAMLAYRRRLNELALLGQASKNVTGLYNNASVTSAVTPSGKKWDGTDGSPATVAQILSDVGFLLYQVWLASSFNVVPNFLLIPPGAYQYLDTTPASASIPGVTILEFIRKNNICASIRGQQLTIAPAFDLATAGAGSTGRAIAYDNSNDTCVMHHPMPLQFLAPQLEGTKVNIPGEFRATGTEVRRVTNMRYMDGVQ